MTAALARVLHSIPGRARLRVEDLKGEGEALSRLRAALLETPGVHEVTVNPRTGSVLLEHTGSLEEVLREAEHGGALRLATDAPEPYFAQLHRALLESDGELRRASRGKLDLETLTFFGFLAGGLYQVTHGHALPAGVTLLRYAVEMVTGTAVEQLAAATAELASAEKHAPRR